MSNVIKEGQRSNDKFAIPIVSKSILRFCRITVVRLNKVSLLKDKDVNLPFEKENI